MSKTDNAYCVYLGQFRRLHEKNFYINSIKIGIAAKALVTYFRRIRYLLLNKVGQSKWKKGLVNAFLFGLIASLLILISFFLYFVIGFIGPIIILLVAIALPKTYSSYNDDDLYSFNDGYRDGPEGYGYYSGGYKVDD